jgi:hypothetical protein
MSEGGTTMPLRLYAWFEAVRTRLAPAGWRLDRLDRLRRLDREAGFSTAEGLAGAALAVVALIAIWAAMKAFGLDLINWMQDQITGAGGGTGG